MLVVDVADMAFGTAVGTGTGTGIKAQSHVASPAVFGSHLSIRAASSLRLSVSTEERTPAALKIMDLLKSCQSMYPDQPLGDGMDMSERDENCENNASRHIFASPAVGRQKSSDTASSMAPAVARDQPVRGRGESSKANLSKKGGSSSGLESASVGRGRTPSTGSFSPCAGSTSHSKPGRNRNGACNESDFGSAITSGLGSSRVTPKGPRPHDLSGTEVRRAVLINNVARSSLPIFDIMSPGSKLRSPPSKTPQSGMIMTGAFLKPSIPDTKPHERVLQMERVMSYSGGPSLVLYQGKLLVIASASLLVLIDVEGSAGCADRSNPGLWRIFKSFHQGVLAEAGGEGTDRDKAYIGRIEGERGIQTSKAVLGCEQAFLRGHTAAIGLLELSPSGVLMASAETCAGGAVMIWNIMEGKRIATFRPHVDGVTSVAFNHDNSMIVTTGTDAQRRVQITIWDTQTLTTQGAPLSIVARQISEFPISKIRFSPFEDASLVACGRENIRFFRIRKKHLPACPVQLNEFSRGFIFTDLVFNLEPGQQLLDAQRSCAFFSSNRGVLLKVDCTKKQVLCGYQLHSGPIQSLAIHEGYAVTGGGDSRLRIWPLDFSDFLLEAQHEAAVTSICVSGDGRKLSVGTSAGTLGVLNVSQHSYDTILRSHVGAITFGAARNPAAEEFVTLGKDTTIRLWDVFTGTQKYEFNSPSDEPLCAAYHPTEYSLAVGFRSGALRVFDIESTATIIERKIQKGSVTALLYARSSSFPTIHDTSRNNFSSRSASTTMDQEVLGDTVGQFNSSVRSRSSDLRGMDTGSSSDSSSSGYLLLFTAGLDGDIIVYDAENKYILLKTLSAVPSPSESIRMALSSDQRLLAVAGATVSSITVYDTQQLIAVYRGGHIQNLAQQALHTGSRVQPLCSEGLSPSGLGSAISPSSISSPIMFTPNMGSSMGGAGTSTGLDPFGQSKPCDLSAAVTGVAFCDDRPGGSLLIATERHIVSLPLEPDTPYVGEEGMRRKKRSAWDSRSVRRLEFGCPVTMTRDITTGLLFMTLKAPVTRDRGADIGTGTGTMSSSGKATKDKDGTPGSGSKGSPGSSSRLTNQADCLAVVAARHRPYNPKKLSLSPAQLYQGHLGAVTGVCPCTPCGRVVSFDDAGSMIIWRLLDEQVASLKASNSPSQPVQAMCGTGDTGGLYQNEIESDRSCGSGDQREGEDFSSEDEAMKYERILERKKIRPPREKKEKYVNKFEKRARGLIKDFELAVKTDPDAWCTSTFPSYADEKESFSVGPGPGPSMSNSFNTVRVDRGMDLDDFHFSDKNRFTISSILGGSDSEEEGDGRVARADRGRDKERTGGLKEREMVSQDGSSDCYISGSEEGDGNRESDDEEDSFEEIEEAINGLSHWHSVDPVDERMDEMDSEEMAAKIASEALERRKEDTEEAIELVKGRVRDRRAEGLGGDMDVPSGPHGAAPYELSATNMVITAAPSYCSQEKILLLTDGLSVSLKNIRDGTDTLLPRALVPEGIFDDNIVGSPRRLITSVGSIIQTSISPSGLFVAAVMEVSVSAVPLASPSAAQSKGNVPKTSRELFLWFHDITAQKGAQGGRNGDGDGDRDGPWVSLGSMGIQQMAIDSMGGGVNNSGSSSSSKTACGITEFISCGKPSSPSCGISVDWLHDDTLVVAVSMPIKAPDYASPGGRGKVGANTNTTNNTNKNTNTNTNSGKRRSKLLTRSRFDVAFTALCVSDLLTGGYCPLPSDPSKQGASESRTGRVTGAGAGGSGSRPSVSVLRGVDGDLRGMRCIPSTTAPQSSAYLDAEGKAEGGDEDEEGELELELEGKCPRGISIVIWGGSQLLSLTFPLNRVNSNQLVNNSRVACAISEVDVIFIDDVGAKGPILSVDMVHYSVSEIANDESTSTTPDTSLSRIVPQPLHSHATSLAVHSNVPIPSMGIEHSAVATATSGSTLYQSHTTLAAVDSLGNVKMCLIPHSALALRDGGARRVGPSPLLSSYAKIPSANTSGTFRTLALSSRAPQDRRDLSSSSSSMCPSYCLALGSASVIVKVFSVSVVDSSTYSSSSLSSSPSFHLALLYRVNTFFVPDYLFSIPLLPPESDVDDGIILSDAENSSGHWTPDLLVVGTKGDLGFLPSSKYSSLATDPIPSSITAVVKSSAAHPSVECLTLRSALSPLGPCPRLLDNPPPRSLVNVVSCSTARLTAILYKGKLQLLASDSGVQLPFPNPTGIHSGTALASTPSVLAVGSSCGSVSIYRASTMRLIKVIAGSIDSEREKERERDRMKTDDRVGRATSLVESEFGTIKGSGFSGQGSFFGTSKSPRFSVGGKVDLKLLNARESASPVVKMEFICNGRALLVMHANGRVTVTNTEFIDKFDQTDYSKMNTSRDMTYSRERGRGGELEKDSAPSIYLCSSLTSEVPVHVLLSDQIDGPLLLATCGSGDVHDGSDTSSGGSVFGLVYGSVLHAFKVDLPEHSVQLSRGEFLLTIY